MVRLILGVGLNKTMKLDIVEVVSAVIVGFICGSAFGILSYVSSLRLIDNLSISYWIGGICFIIGLSYGLWHGIKGWKRSENQVSEFEKSIFNPLSWF